MICGFQFQAERILLCTDCRDSAPIVLSVFLGFLGNWVFTAPHRHCGVPEVFASCVRPSEWSKAMTPKQRLGTRYCWGIATGWAHEVPPNRSPTVLPRRSLGTTEDQVGLESQARTPLGVDGSWWICRFTLIHTTTKGSTAKWDPSCN